MVITFQMSDVKHSKPVKKRKRLPTTRKFVFTVNTVPQDDLAACAEGMQLLLAHFKSSNQLKRARFQLERGDEKQRLHYQGALYTHEPMTCSALHKLFPPGMSEWVEPMRASLPDGFDYAAKLDSRVLPPVEFGGNPREGQGKRTDLTSFVADAKAMASPGGLSIAEMQDKHIPIEARCMRYFDRVISRCQPPRSVKTYVTVICGPAGTGKTSACHKEAAGCNPPYRLHPITLSRTATHVQWYDGIEGQIGAIINEFVPNGLAIPEFNQLADEDPHLVPVHGGSHVQWIVRNLYITSNIYFDFWWPKETFEQRMTALRRVDELWTTDYGVPDNSDPLGPHLPDDLWKPNDKFTNAKLCAEHAVWTRVK